MTKQRRHTHHIRGSDVVLIGIATFLAGLVLGAFITPLPRLSSPQPIARFENGTQVIMHVPAVDPSGAGVLGQLVTEVRPGTGKVLVNVVDLITLGDTQESAQHAVRAGGQYVGADLSTVDISFTMVVNASAIEGPSAGASMAIAVVFGLRNETPRSDVVMTGTIDETGRIGRIGGVLEKARSAKDGGATIFVVPRGQSTSAQTVRTRQCRQVGTTQHCRIVYESQPVNIGEQLNLTVVEAGTIAEAIGYFQQR